MQYQMQISRAKGVGIEVSKQVSDLYSAKISEENQDAYRGWSPGGMIS